MAFNLLDFIKKRFKREEDQIISPVPPTPTPDKWVTEKGFTKAGGGYYKADEGLTFIDKAKIPEDVVKRVESEWEGARTKRQGAMEKRDEMRNLVKEEREETLGQFKYQGAIDKAGKQVGLTTKDFHLLRAGENQAENPEAINYNSDGTIDVGLFQINVDPKNKAEVERLKDPEYNTKKAGEIFKQRLNILEDPVLALASYNLGAGGAVLNPEAAIKRAEWVYWKAGVPMPETEFTRNPLQYVRKRMDKYKQMGLFR